MTTTAPHDSPTRSPDLWRGRWIDHREPEDPQLWERTGARTTRRNPWVSIPLEAAR